MDTQSIYALFKDTKERITRNPEEWIRFLNTVSHIHKYSFTDQVLIYAQNPNASACATIRQWNELTQRFVPENSKAIALLRSKNGQAVLQYVFDIADTIETEYSTAPFDWHIKDEWHHMLLERLPSTSENLTIPERYAKIGSIATSTFIKDNTVRVECGKLQTEFNQTMLFSVQYTLLNRLGIAPSTVGLTPEVFSHIGAFSESNLLTSLGCFINEIVKPILNEIETEVENIRKNLAISADKDYTTNNKNFSNLIDKSVRREHNENSISESGGLSDSESNRAGTSESRQPGKIRNAKRNIPEGTPTGDLHRNAHGTDTRRSSPGDGSKRKKTDRADNRSTEDNTWSDRRTQEIQPNDLGAANKYGESRSGGNDSPGADLQLSFDFLPSVSTQRNTIKVKRQKAVEMQSAAFSITQISLDDLQPMPAAAELAKKTSGEKTNKKSSIEVSPTFAMAQTDFVSVGAREKYKVNIAAIKLLKSLEEEKRQATPEERHILAKYVGWGGVQEAFDSHNEKWKNEYEELKSVLTDDEYRTARASVLTAHYTPSLIIQSMYQAVGNMGIPVEKIIDPALGSGRYLGMLPSSLANAKFSGVEIETVTGNLAKHLYPKADIQVTGFEKAKFQKDSFDLAIGNVPYGNFGVADPAYNKHKFSIHEYFFAKSLDLVRTGGIVAFITSRYSMDQQGNKFRQYMAERADLLGAIRLPDNAFKDAGTSVTADILFFQKRPSVPQIMPSWIHVAKTEDGLPINNYFKENPQMVAGEIKTVSGSFGPELACKPLADKSFEELLLYAVAQIKKPNLNYLQEIIESTPLFDTIPANPEVSNFSFAAVGSEIYYRENDDMHLFKGSDNAKKRIALMIEMRETTHALLKVQLDNEPDEVVKEYQALLEEQYEAFTQKYGLINSSANKRVFCDDDSYALLCSLEILDDDGNLECKADMFTKRTIAPAHTVTEVQTASDALAVSLAEKAKVDMRFMAALLPGNFDANINTLVEDLKGQIFKSPTAAPPDSLLDGWQTADEYLSGNVRKKLEMAKKAAENDSTFALNVEYLEKAQPKDLTAAEIEVRLGAPWIGLEYYKQFMIELLNPQRWHISGDEPSIDLQYSKATNEWRIKGKSVDRTNAKVISTFGTDYKNAYYLLEDCLNQRDTRIYKTIIEDGKEKRVLEPQKTAIVQQKQESIAMAFQTWIWKDPERRIALCEKYNKELNSIRPREYNGDHIKFVGMSPEISLRPHQRNAVARGLYGDNTLLAHCVGAGKTFVITAIAMESKRLGLCRKSFIVVPNHLTEQWGSEWLRLYPNANILVTRKKDFEPLNRKKFCARIATGNYDAVIIGHSQFEKIQLSPEYQEMFIQEQINQIKDELEMLENEEGQHFTVKQMEKKVQMLETKLSKLNSTEHKDNTVSFEELGIDRLFVDEAHSYKNLFLYTKMRNVAGIGQTDAQKSSDMFMKCRYIDKITNNSGIVFATGTPISNSMVELYTMMRYLQYQMLEEHDFLHFDNWAATFGEKVTALEIAPEGTGFRTKTRFAKFFDLPELMNLWKECADIQTADMLQLPTPKAVHETIVTKPTEFQKNTLLALADRAKAVRDGQVDSKIDNMLKITSDGRKLALDQRMNNSLLPDDPTSKINACVRNIKQVWDNTANTKGAQIVFCDLSTPNTAIGERDPNFSNAYVDIKWKLVDMGVPEEEIAFIHDAKTDIKKAELFAKVRKGAVRIIIGSTAKMGAGTNIQDRLAALHHLDCPWRPSDIEQREGRILRQGNMYDTVSIFKYVTENTFDAYNWSLIESKQKFIGQVMTSKSPVRSADDVDATALSYAEVKSLATGDPRIKDKMDLDIQVAKLKLLKANYLSQKHMLEDRILLYYPAQISKTKEQINSLKKDIAELHDHPLSGNAFHITVAGKVYDERSKAGAALIEVCKRQMSMLSQDERASVGMYRGFDMQFSYDGINTFFLHLHKNGTYKVEMSSDSVGNIMRIQNTMNGLDKALESKINQLERLNAELITAQEEVKIPFAEEENLEQKTKRLNQLNTELSNDTPQIEKPRMVDQLRAAGGKADEYNHPVQSKKEELNR